MGESSSGKGSRSKARFSVLGDRKDATATTTTTHERRSSGGRGRSRRRKKQPQGPPANPQLHDPDSKSSRRRRRRGRRGRGRPGGASPTPRPDAQKPQPAPDSKIDAFELFAAYHLGISEEGSYRPTNIHDVARRFNTSAGGIRQTLAAYGMDSDSVINSAFDMAMAQYDIQVAPEGVNIRELARNLYREYCDASPNARDWEKELAEDAAANAKTFGNDEE